MQQRVCRESPGMSRSLLISARADGSSGHRSYQTTCLSSFVSPVATRWRSASIRAGISR